MSELGPEPASSAEGVCEISIRKLSGSGRFSRRFIKTNTVSQIKDYIDSLPHEDVGFEDEDETLGLPEYQLMLQNKELDLEATLEQEGLFPRALIILRQL